MRPAARNVSDATRASEVTRALEAARAACGPLTAQQSSYWRELSLAIGQVAHLHNLATGVLGEEVSLRVPPMLVAFALYESHHATHALMLEAVAAVRKRAEGSSGVDDLSAAAE